MTYMCVKWRGSWGEYGIAYVAGDRRTRLTDEIKERVSRHSMRLYNSHPVEFVEWYEVDGDTGYGGRRIPSHMIVPLDAVGRPSL